jgi:hypothetical protein
MEICGHCRSADAAFILVYGCLNLHIIDERVCGACASGIVLNMKMKTNGSCYQCRQLGLWREEEYSWQEWAVIDIR